MLRANVSPISGRSPQPAEHGSYTPGSGPLHLRAIPLVRLASIVPSIMAQPAEDGR